MSSDGTVAFHFIGDSDASEPLEPSHRSSLYIITVVTICIFAETMSPIIFNLRRDLVADVFVLIWETHRRNTIFWHFNSLVNFCGFWFILRLTLLDILHRFREVPHEAPL